MNDKPIPPIPTPNSSAGGMGTLLTTLAGSGDRMVQLLIVGGIILNGFLTTRSGTATRSDVDKVREATTKQIRTIYQNQSVWAAYAEATVEEHRLILEKLGVPKDKWPRMPPLNFEQLEEEGNEEDR